MRESIMKKSRLLLTIDSILIISAMMMSCVSTSVSSDAGNSDTSSKAEIAVSQEDDTEVMSKKEFLTSLENISLKIVSAPRIATIGNKFVRPYVVSVTDNTGAPVPSYPITIRYPAEKKDSEIVYKTENVETDEAGKYSFNPGVLTFAGCGEFSAYPTPVSSNKDVIKAVEEKSANFPWDVKSDLSSRGGILVVWDFTETGRYDDNSSEVLSELRSRGIYNVSNAPFSDSSYVNKTVEQVYKANYEIVGGDSYGYLIYGTIKFDNPVKQTEEGSLCSLTGDIKVLNMKDGSIKMAKTYKQEATGKGWWDSVSKCKSKLAMKIVDSLLYDL